MIDANASGKTRQIAMFVYPDAQILDITGPLEVFARASRWIVEHLGVPYPPYAVELVGRNDGPVRTSSGLELIVHRSCEERLDADTLLVTGGIGFFRVIEDAAALAWLRLAAKGARRVGSICTGSLILGAARLLEDRKATTHWAYFETLCEVAPSAHVVRDAIYVRDGNIYTSAGVTAGIDLALAMVEEDWGRSVALRVAQALVVYLVRPGGQKQFSRELKAQQRQGPMGQIELWMMEHLCEPLTVERLADKAAMSTRNLTRRFIAEFGTSPAAHLTQLRVERARAMIEQDSGRLLKDAARECGFGSEQNMRRAFLRTVGVTPDDYRDRFGAGRICEKDASAP